MSIRLWMEISGAPNAAGQQGSLRSYTERKPPSSSFDLDDKRKEAAKSLFQGQKNMKEMTRSLWNGKAVAMHVPVEMRTYRGMVSLST